MPEDLTNEPGNRVPAEGSVTLTFPNGGGDIAAGQSTPADKFFARTTAQASVDAGRAYLMQHPEEIPQSVMKPVADAQTEAQRQQVEGAAPEIEPSNVIGDVTHAVVGKNVEKLTGSPTAGRVADLMTDLIPAAVGLKGAIGSDVAGVEGATAATAPLDIAGETGGHLPKTSEAFQAAQNHPDATPELKTALDNLKPAIRDPDTGDVYLANDPNAKNHYQVFGDLPQDIADKPKLDTGFVGPENEYMTRQQAADHLIAAQATGTPVESGGLTGMARGSMGGRPIPEPVALTPEAAVNSLAQQQAVALKQLKVGKTVADRMGRPDIATTIPEADTMAAGAAQQMTPEEVAAQVDKLPISQRVAAWTATIDNEAQAMRATARDIVQRAANGENVDADLADLNNRYGAFARGGSAVQMAQGTEVARGLEIMNPLKPNNLSIAAAARIAQQLPEDYSPMMLAEMLAKQTPAQILKSAVMADRVSGKGASVGQMLYSLYRFGMLADLKTPARILLSNAATSLMEVPVRAVAPYLGDAGEIGNRESLDMLTAVPTGIKTGLRMWSKSVTQGGNAQDLRVMEQLAGTDYARNGANAGYLSGASPLSSQGTSLEGTILGAGLDHLGDYMETGMGALVTGPHQFGKSMAQEMELNALARPIARAQAIAEGLSGAKASARIEQLMPIIKARPDLFAASADWSDFATFTRQTEGQGIVNSLANSSNPFAKGVGTIGQWLFPFRSISNQMIRYGAGWIPLPITRENWAGFTEVSRAGALSRARMGLGTAIGSAVAYECLKGNITPDGPQSKQARLMNVEQGIAPNSVRLPNGTYVGIPEPYRMPVSLIANAIEAAPYLKQAVDDGHPILDEMGNKVTPELALYMAMLGTARAFTDMPTMETASHIFDLVDGVSSDKDISAKVSQFTSQLAGGAIPLSTIERQASNANDPSLREVNDWMTSIRNRIYPLSKDGYPTRDWRGKPVVGQPGVFANMLSPINITKENLDAADQLLQQNGVKVPAVPYYIGGAPGLVPDPNAPAPVPLDGRARDQWAKFRGGYDERDNSSMLEQEVLGAANSKAFDAMPRAGKNIELTHIVTRASVLATAQLIGWAQKNDPKLFAQIIQHKMAKAVAMTPNAIPDNPPEPEEAGATP